MPEKATTKAARIWPINFTYGGIPFQSSKKQKTAIISNPIKKRAFVTHSSKMEISSKIVQILKDYGFENVYDCDASATISSHCAPNTLGILFMNK